MDELNIDNMATFCKRKGFVYPNSEIYGGLAGFWDFGHLGVELKNNLKLEWWNSHVRERRDIAGLDGSIITNPKVWIASGHVASFEDIMISCKKCKNKVRADVLVEEKLKISANGLKASDINNLVKDNKLKCQKCGSDFEDAGQFNLMFKTEVGPSGGNLAYLRPETAQLIFTNFKLVSENARLSLPFGIAQIGRSFRNEISPRDFLFRCREFEQMELEYFVHPEKTGDCPFISEFIDYEMLVYSADMQEEGKEPKKMKVKELLSKKIIKTSWHAYWLSFEHNWFCSLGANPDNFRVRQHLLKEKSHYALDTWDLEYKFPFGWKELEGLANRADFDLKQHMEHSKVDLSIFDEEQKKKIIPYVICEPSLGVERAFLVFMFDAYNDDKERGNVVLKLHPKLAPIKAGVFPLVNKLEEDAEKVYNLLKKEFACFYDLKGSIGRRYARMDEAGTPYCITIDFQTKEDSKVTIRDRNTTKQARVDIKKLKEVISQLIKGERKFEDLN